MRNVSFLLLIGLLACDSGNANNDGGATDATNEPLDLCDLNSFSGNGNPCPRASTRLCFQECDGGCKCTDSTSGPVWACTTDLSCMPDAGPLLDTGTPDVGDDSASDAADDAADAGTE